MILPVLNLDTVPEDLHQPTQLWWERAFEQPALALAYQGLSAGLREQLPRVVAGSEFIGAALIRDADSLNWLSRHQDPDSVRAANRAYEAGVTASPTFAQAQQLLREWRRREMVRIAWLDIAGSARVAETLSAVSELADACIRAASAAAQRLLQPIFGRPRDAQAREVPLIVLGMGKLGGRELNFSSDIDLIFLFSLSGETDGDRVIDNAEYFNRLGRDLIRLLDEPTDDGFVFRVDMRLRPFGESGPLVVSLASLENYLQEHGRDWERYAWIKARVLVGAEPYAAAYQEFVRPFVYRRYLDFGVFDSLRSMKALIEREVSRRDLDQHLKLGRGGIREIEFIVQSLQLVRGGSDRRLQTPELLAVLPLLESSKLLSGADVAELRDAYLALRKAENGLQIIRDQQTHTVPEDARDRARLALNSGFMTWSEAGTALQNVRDKVAKQFEALLFGSVDQSRRKDDAGIVWLDSDDAKISEELARSGFPVQQIAAVGAILEAYRTAATYRRLDDAGHRRLHVIIDRLLKAAAQSPAPALVVQRVVRVLEAIGTRSSYLALLKEQPPALNRLIEICAISGFLARQIADFPLLLDELIDAKAFDELPSREAFAAELAARTERLAADDPERQVETLRQFQKAAVFKVALADLTERLPLMRVSDRLTDIAELILQFCVDLAWQQMTQSYGVPCCGEDPGHLRPVVVAVAGYGKLGGLELGYGSDLDLVFLHDSSGSVQQTQGDRPLDNGVFFLRLGQRIVHLLTMHSAAGRLYEVDMRLRPNGKGGFLMTGIDAFERYQREEAWTWEHQALLRARALAGDSHLCRAFEEIRHKTLTGFVHRDTLRGDVMEMRLRMRKELSKAGPDEFDIKHDAGGIGDIEFLVQYWVLTWAASHPELLTHTDNIRQLEGLAAVGVLDADTAEWLKQAYIGYRTVLHHLSLEAQGERVVPAVSHAKTRAGVRAIWQQAMQREDTPGAERVEASANALLNAWTGPFGGVPPFDAVKVADFKPALEASMRANLEEIDGIAKNPAAPTFDNTIAALERAGRGFNRVSAIYGVWSSTMSTPDFQAVEREMQPKLAAFADKIHQNIALFARIEAVYQSSAPGLLPIQRRLCWYYHNNFVRAGANLDSAAKLRVASINERLASLFARFSQNLLADETECVLLLQDEQDLAGLPQALRDAARSAAALRGVENQWAILNTRSSMDPFLTYADRRDLRERVWRNYYSRGDNGDAHDNKQIITEILALRSERAALLGFATHAHWRVADSMAKTPENAMDLLMAVWPAAVAREQEEVADMQAIAEREGERISIAAWDYRYYAEKVRKAKYNLEMNAVKPYLQLEKLREGMFWVAGQLYGLRFGQVYGLPTATPDVRVWEVKNAADDHLGLWYFDPYARPGKNSGAWMSEYRRQDKLDSPIHPIVSNNTNFVKDASGKPILVSWDDAVTLFHEFGHALHGLNSDVPYPSLAGTNVVRDFVEFPSQLNENWLSTTEVLSRFAVHGETGAPIPLELVAKIKAAQTFNQGFATVEYLASALIDMKLHMAGSDPIDPAEFERNTLAALGMPREMVMRHRTPQFAHIFSGDSYSAGYYSYLWAEVLDHDAFQAFLEAGGPYDKAVAKRLHDDIMSIGNSIDPAQAYRNFRGADPKIDGLLRARGFAAVAKQDQAE